MLQDSEKLYQTLVEFSQDIIAVTDRNGQLQYVNTYAAKLLNKDPKDIIGKYFADIFPPVIAQRMLHNTQKVFSSGQPLYSENQMILNGQEVWQGTKITPLRFNDAEIEFSHVLIVSRDISTSKQIEEVLRENEEQFRQIILQMPLPIEVADVAGNALMVNQAFLEMFHMPSADSVVGIFNSFSEPLVKELGIMDSIKKVRSGHPVFIPELAVPLDKIRDRYAINREGIIYLEITLFPVFMNANELWRIVSVWRDISERKKLEETLRQSEIKYRTLLQEATDPIVLADPLGNLLEINTKAEMLFGYNREEIIKMNFSNLHPKEEHQRIIDTFKEIILQGSARIYDTKVLTKDGRVIPIDIAGSVVEYGGKEVLQGIFRDMSERKKIENELKMSEQRYRTVVENQTEMINKYLPDTAMTFVNQATCNFIGKKPEELIGKSYLPFLPKEDQKCVKKMIADFSISNPVITLEHRVINQNGKIGWHQWMNRGIFNENGQLVEIQAVGRDITARKEAELKLARVNKELNSSNKKLKQMSVKDPHTGLFNHRYLTDILEREFTRSKKYKHPLSLILIDIDYFKAINDTYGHGTGDLVLKQLAHLIKQLASKEQSVIRYAGEEFLILAPDTTREQGLDQAQAILDKINMFKFGDKKRPFRLRVSMAVCSYPEDTVVESMELLDKADQMISKAKESGGNRVLSAVDLHIKQILPLLKDSRKINVKELKKSMLRLNKRSNQNAVEAIFAFGKAIELKDHYTGEHVDQTVHFATEIAKELKLPHEDILLIKQASMLHDLGKIGIGDKLLLKPAKLTPKEFREIRKHPTIGADIIRPIHLLHGIIPHILYHHERWDGKGYPARLKGEKIPLGARIIALADVYQALTSNRPYRKAYSKKEALKIIKKESGSHFDPRIVNAFLQVIKNIK